MRSAVSRFDFPFRSLAALAAAMLVSSPVYAQAPRTLTLSGVIGMASPEGRSWLVITNAGDTPQTVDIDILSPDTGLAVAPWKSGPIRPQTALVVSARDIETAYEGPRTLQALNVLTLRVTASPSVSVQHLVVRNGALAADAGCGAAVDGAPRLIGNVFGASAQPSFISVFEATNTHSAPLDLRVVLLDPLNGLPTYSWIETIPARSTRSTSIPFLEARIGAVVGGFWERYTARVEGDPRIQVRHRVMAGATGAAADATLTCALAKVPEVTTQTP